MMCRIIQYGGLYVIQTEIKNKRPKVICYIYFIIFYGKWRKTIIKEYVPQDVM